MKRSLQEVAELVVFGLIALLVGTGLLWLVGWVLSLGGVLLKSLAGLLWLLLRYIVPIAIVAGLVYFLVKAAQGRQPQAAGAAGTGSAPPSGQGGVQTIDVAAAPAAGVVSTAEAVVEAAAEGVTTVAETAADAAADVAAAVEESTSAADPDDESDSEHA